MPSKSTTLICLGLCILVGAYIFYKYDEVTKKSSELRRYPFMVFLDIQDGIGSACGGSLIDQRRILTAAHCLDKVDFINAILGLETLLEINDYYYFPINNSRFAIHEHFNPSTYENDIALIYLDKDVQLNDKINVVDLPSDENVPDDEDAMQVLLGWSFDEKNLNDRVLIKRVTILDKSKCKKIKSQLDNTIICALGTSKFKPCMGDSGGPLLSGDIQIGVLSGGPKKCTGLAVYTRVEKYLPWIQDHVFLHEELNTQRGKIHLG